MRQIFITLLVFFGLQGFPQSFIPGYQKTIFGEQLSYHSPQPDANASLLVRSEDSSRYIEWESGGTLQGFKPLQGV